MAALKGAMLPWYVKLSAKLVLARLPVRYQGWRGLGLFKHGFMLDPDYALAVFERHYDAVRAELPEEWTVLELGPGDSLATAPIAAVRGARRSWLVDVASFAADDVDAYRPLLQRLGEAFPQSVASLSELLAASRSEYLTNGLASLRALPAGSVDFSFSHAVLEHVAREEFDSTLAELHRLHRPGSLTSHRVDLRDHLAQALHSLRFSPRVWESSLFKNSGFYTNRLRASEIQDAFERTGFQVVSVHADRWDDVPLARPSLHPAFRHFADDDLRVHGLTILARRI